MSANITFDEALDAVEQLPDEQQADLVDVVRRRLAFRWREQLLTDIREGQAEYATGKLRPATVGGDHAGDRPVNRVLVPTTAFARQVRRASRRPHA